MDLQVRQHLTKADRHKDPGALRTAYTLLTDGSTEESSSYPELYVLCAEQGLQLGCTDMSTDCLRRFLTGSPPANQFLGRAYLCQAQLCSTEDVDKAVMYFLKAIEVTKQQPRYHFLVFNASLLYMRTVRSLLRPGTRKLLVHSLTQVVKALQEIGEEDCDWRAELMLELIECLIDAGRVEEASSFASQTSDFIEAHAPHLCAKLFSLQVQHCLIDTTEIQKRTDSSTALLVVYRMQQLWHNSQSTETNTAHENELKEIFVLLTSPTDTDIEPLSAAQRIAFLLELAYLSLHLMLPQVAGECVSQLERHRASDVRTLIRLECLKCELQLRGVHVAEYSRKSVQARLKVVSRLDSALQVALCENDEQLVQSVCVTQWNVCLPLLQHNLRNTVRTQLRHIAQALEDMGSLLFDTRCQMHAELADIEAERDHLDSAQTHLNKALKLDVGGALRERLHFALLQLKARVMLHETAGTPEEEAAVLIQQAKTDRKKRRSLLVRAGTALAPQHFPAVISAEAAHQGSVELNPVEQLVAKAQHHTNNVQKVNEHLSAEPPSNDRERVRLWAELAKTARRLQVWEVCRAACRFCLLYDDGRWTLQNADNKDEKHNYTAERELIRLLAKIHFINAEATIEKLRSEEVHLNQGAEPDGLIYREWIQSLSAYATAGFLRGAELGAELQELWIIYNAAIYMWNHNKHVLAKKEHHHTHTALHALLQLLRHGDYERQLPLLLVLLMCSCVAQALVQRQCNIARKSEEENKNNIPAPKTPKRNKKKASNTESVTSAIVDLQAVQDASTALELCEFALLLAAEDTSIESVPQAGLKQIISVWVKIRQQTAPKANDDEQRRNIWMTPLNKVLIGIEEQLCSESSRHMEIPKGRVHELVSMALSCRWTDPALELEVWTHLTRFAYQAQEQSTVLSCSHNALQLQTAVMECVKASDCTLYSYASVQHMLGVVTCLRAVSEIHTCAGHSGKYKAALEGLLSAVQYAQRAGSHRLCEVVAWYYWDACRPLMGKLQWRQELRDGTESVLRAVCERDTSEPQVAHSCVSRQQLTDRQDVSDVVSLRIALHTLLFHILADTDNWAAGLDMLEKAVRQTHNSKERLLLYELCVKAKSRLGHSILMDAQRFNAEGEQRVACVWRHAACSYSDKHQQRFSYQNALTCLQSSESSWYRINALLQFGAWLYTHHFPITDAKQQVQLAMDLLQNIRAQSQTDADSEVEETSYKAVVEQVRKLYALLQAHTLLAVMEDRNYPEYQQHLLQAYSCVIRTWQMSLTAVPLTIATLSSPAKSKKKKEAPPPQVQNFSLPSNAADWARYECPSELTQTLRAGAAGSQERCVYFLCMLLRELLSLSLDPLVLPVLQLSLVITGELLGSQSLSDTFRLRMAESCSALGLNAEAEVQMKLITAGIPEEELTEVWKAVFEEQKSRGLPICCHKHISDTQQRWRDHAEWLLHVWLEKAELCVHVGVYPTARILLTEACSLAKKLQVQSAMARSHYLQACLASQEHKHTHTNTHRIHRHTETVALLEACGDEEFWMKVALCVADAVGGAQACSFLECVAAVFTSVLPERANRAATLRFHIANLESRRAVLQAQQLLLPAPSASVSVHMSSVLRSSCEKLQHCTNELLTLGFHKHAREVCEKHAEILRTVAAHLTDSEEQHRHLLDALTLLQKAVALQEEVLHDTKSPAPIQEMGVLTYPAQQQMQDVRLALVEHALHMLEQVYHEQMAERQKSSIQRAFEEFLCKTPSDTQKEWQRCVPLLAPLVLAQLEVLSNLGVSTQCMLGKCVRVQALLRDPECCSRLWEQHTAEQPSEPETPVKSKVKKKQTLKSGQSLSQAGETLSECLSVFLQQGSTHTLIQMCTDLVECTGRSDPRATGQYLALLQSCCCCEVLNSTMTAAVSTANSSQSALLSLQQHLQARRDNASFLGKVCESLEAQSHMAFANLRVNREHLTLLNEFPEGFSILLLQHSLDRCVLYGGFYQQAKPAVTQKGRGGLHCTSVARACVCPQALKRLLDNMRTFRQQMQQECLRSSCGDEMACVFRSVVQQMEAYLQPLLSQLDSLCSNNPPASLPSTEKQATEKAASAEQGRCIIVLADEDLLELPLEALRLLRQDDISCVSRDMSLQLLHSRLRTQERVESDNKTEAKGSKTSSKGKKDQSQSMKALILPPDGLPVDILGFKYVVDPYHQAQGCEWSPSSAMRQAVQKQGTNISPQWQGAVGDQHTPSVAELENWLTHCSSFLYSGLQPFLCYVPPAKITALDLSGCQLMVLLDGAETHVSRLRQQECLSPSTHTHAHTVLLLSLSGVRSVFLGQWSYSLQENTRLMDTITQRLLGSNMSTGQTVHSLRLCPVQCEAAEPTGAESSELQDEILFPRDFNVVLYGLPNLVLM